MAVELHAHTMQPSVCRLEDCSMGPSLPTTRVVTMGPVDVECHNQLMGHLPTCSRSGGSSHAHIGSHYRQSSVPILEQQDGDGPPVWL